MNINFNTYRPNLEMRTFHTDLAVEVEKKFGSLCPCCRNPMVRPRKRNDTNRRRRDKISVAHDHAVSNGGSPQRWVYACQGCNTDQGSRSFKVWAASLRHADDRRAGFVAELADIIAAFYGE